MQMMVDVLKGNVLIIADIGQDKMGTSSIYNVIKSYKIKNKE